MVNQIKNWLVEKWIIIAWAISFSLIAIGLIRVENLAQNAEDLAKRQTNTETIVKRIIANPQKATCINLRELGFQLTKECKDILEPNRKEKTKKEVTPGSGGQPNPPPGLNPGDGESPGPSPGNEPGGDIIDSLPDIPIPDVPEVKPIVCSLPEYNLNPICK